MISLTLIAIVMGVALATPVKECVHLTGPVPIEVRIKGCDQAPCDVFKGKTTEFEIDFKNNQDNEIEKLTAKVKATTLGITVSYPLPNDVADVCTNLLNDQECPLATDEDATYQFNFAIANIYPEISVTIEIGLEDVNKNIISCFQTDIKVKKSS